MGLLEQNDADSRLEGAASRRVFDLDIFPSSCHACLLVRLSIREQNKIKDGHTRLKASSVQAVLAICGNISSVILHFGTNSRTANLPKTQGRFYCETFNPRAEQRTTHRILKTPGCGTSRVAICGRLLSQINIYIQTKPADGTRTREQHGYSNTSSFLL